MFFSLHIGIKTVLLSLFLIHSLSVRAETGISQEAAEICASIEIEGGTEQERQAVCDAFEFILQTLSPYGIKYDWENPIQRIEFHDHVRLKFIKNPALKDHISDEEHDQWFGTVAGAYFSDTKTVHMQDYSHFSEIDMVGLTVDFEVWQAMLPVHELAHYFTDVNNNDAAMTFFEEALSYYVEIEFLGIEKAKVAKSFDSDKYQNRFMTEGILKVSPSAFSIISWQVISERPEYYIPRILNGEINEDYLRHAE